MGKKTAIDRRAIASAQPTDAANNVSVWTTLSALAHVAARRSAIYPRTVLRTRTDFPFIGIPIFFKNGIMCLVFSQEIQQ